MPASTRTPSSATQRRPCSEMGAGIDYDQGRAIAKAIDVVRRYYRYNLIDGLFPDDPGHPLYRKLYPKHLEFFAAGAFHNERLFMAANRVGKTVSGGYESVRHGMGVYPDWWIGRRFDREVTITVAGKSKETTRDIIQAKLMGPKESLYGTGLIPAERIGKIQKRLNGGGALDYVEIMHENGKASTLFFKSYDQGRKSFEGTERDVIWEDEEAPEDIHEENLIRTATTGGIMMLTFTPLEGLTPLVLSFCPGGLLPADQQQVQWR